MEKFLGDSLTISGAIVSRIPPVGEPLFAQDSNVLIIASPQKTMKNNPLLTFMQAKVAKVLCNCHGSKTNLGRAIQLYL